MTRTRPRRSRASEARASIVRSRTKTRSAVSRFRPSPFRSPRERRPRRSPRQARFARGTRATAVIATPATTPPRRRVRPMPIAWPSVRRCAAASVASSVRTPASPARRAVNVPAAPAAAEASRRSRTRASTTPRCRRTDTFAPTLAPVDGEGECLDGPIYSHCAGIERHKGCGVDGDCPATHHCVAETVRVSRVTVRSGLRCSRAAARPRAAATCPIRRC